MKKVEGEIAYYGLQEWWFSSFTETERIYIDDCYQPMGAPPHSLTKGIYKELYIPAPEFLNGLNSWFRNNQDSSIAERIHQKISELGQENPINKPGYYNGRHFTTWVRDFEMLKKNGDFCNLEKLLIGLVNSTEEQSAEDGMGVAPAYYHELAILYRKQKEYSKEVSILERYAKQKHAPGAMPTKRLDRLQKAKQLVENPR